MSEPTTTPAADAPLAQNEIDQVWPGLVSEDEDGDYEDARDSEEQAGAVLNQVRQALGQGRISAETEKRFVAHVAALDEEGWDAGGARDTEELAGAWIQELNEVLAGQESSSSPEPASQLYGEMTDKADRTTESILAMPAPGQGRHGPHPHLSSRTD